MTSKVVFSSAELLRRRRRQLELPLRLVPRR
jgi:hypothetical protein